MKDIRDIVRVMDNEVLVTNSRSVAEVFGKRHDNIMRDIVNTMAQIKSSSEMRGVEVHMEEYFIDTHYQSGNGQWYKEYLITKSGFTLLAMGLNGDKAMGWKIRYMETFEAMEAELKSRQTGVPQLSREEEIVLQIYGGGVEAVVAVRELTDMKVKEAVAPLELKIEEDKEKVEFTETVLKSDDTILIRELAKVISDEVIQIGQNKLYAKLREWGMILKGSTEPTQAMINKGYFVVEERVTITTYATKINTVTKCTPKGQIAVIKKFKKELAKGTL